MSSAPRWEVEGRDWPNRTHSRFVEAGRLRWHVQVMGEGPALLLLHGTGAATHSWRARSRRCSRSTLPSSRPTCPDMASRLVGRLAA